MEQGRLDKVLDTFINRAWTVESIFDSSQKLVKTPPGDFKQEPEEFWGAADLVALFKFLKV